MARAAHVWQCAVQENLLNFVLHCLLSSYSVLSTLPLPSCLASLLDHLMSLLSLFTDSVSLTLSFCVCPSLSMSLTICPCHSRYVCSFSCVSLLSALCRALLISWKLSRHCSVPVGPALAILCNTLMAPKGRLVHTHIQTNTWTHKKNAFLIHKHAFSSNTFGGKCKCSPFWCFMMHMHFDLCAFVYMCLELKGVFHCVVGGPLMAFSLHLGMLQYHSLIGLKPSWQEIYLCVCVYACVYACVYVQRGMRLDDS